MTKKMVSKSMGSYAGRLIIVALSEFLFFGSLEELLGIIISNSLVVKILFSISESFRRMIISLSNFLRE